VNVRIALAQYRVEAPKRFADFAARIEREVASVAEKGAALVVLPEYLSLELASTLGREDAADFVRSLAALQSTHDDFVAMARSIARRHGVYLLAGTFLLRQPNGRYRNRSYLLSPGGALVFQDKLTLTGFERDAGVIEAGDSLKVFDSAFGRIAIQICYDIEFPLYAHAQCEAGARVLLVPSCTDTLAGATRVRISAQARALENQCYVAQAVTAGEAEWNPALDRNTGRAAVYAPSDRGLPDDGVVAAADSGSAWLLADLDLRLLDTVRKTGQVANAADWNNQTLPNVLRARIERI
jgi:predicted amidohydrolase